MHKEIVNKLLTKPPPRRMEIHHVDRDKSNNNHSNLVVCPDHNYHMILHMRTKVLDLGGDPNIDKWCSGCKELHNKKEFRKDSNRSDGLQRLCINSMKEYRKTYIRPSKRCK